MRMFVLLLLSSPVGTAKYCYFFHLLFVICCCIVIVFGCFSMIHLTATAAVAFIGVRDGACEHKNADRFFAAYLHMRACCCYFIVVLVVVAILVRFVVLSNAPYPHSGGWLGDSSTSMCWHLFWCCCLANVCTYLRVRVCVCILMFLFLFVVVCSIFIAFSSFALFILLVCLHVQMSVCM